MKAAASSGSYEQPAPASVSGSYGLTVKGQVLTGPRSRSDRTPVKICEGVRSSFGRVRVKICEGPSAGNVEKSRSHLACRGIEALSRIISYIFRSRFATLPFFDRVDMAAGACSQRRNPERSQPDEAREAFMVMPMKRRKAKYEA